MALTLSAFNEHLTRIVEDLPVQFEWNGIHNAVKSSPQFTEALIIGGVDQTIDFILFVKRTDIASIPPIGTEIRVEMGAGRWDRCRVLGVKRSLDDAQLISLQMGFARKAP